MPFEIKKIGNEFHVIGPYKDEKEHIYGKHDSEDDAIKQQKALYANVNESDKGESDPLKFKVQDDPTPPPPGGIDKSEKYPRFTPDLFKLPMKKTGVNKRHIMDFEEFMKRINYRTHDGQSDESTQRGHGQNLKGK